jgi:DNA-binding CsgD family transcriptional regulator
MMKDEKLADLSRRERDVVDLLLQGKSNKQIALALGVSERTVEFHFNNIYAKAHVASRVELVLKIRKGKGGNFGNPVESTVDGGDESVDNGNQSARPRAAYSWRNVVSLIKKEVAMTIRVSFEDFENYLKSHPIFFSLLMFLAASFMTRYVVFGIGLYFWVSYALLGLLLGAGSMYFGLSWKKMTTDVNQTRPLAIIVSTALLPLIAAGFDQLYINTVLRYTEPISTTIGNISTQAMWLVAPWGEFYLSTERHTGSDNLWFSVNVIMLLLFVFSLVAGKRFDKSNLATL